MEYDHERDAMIAHGAAADIEIASLKSKLEYIYRTLDSGFTHGVFDFSILKKEARVFVQAADMAEATEIPKLEPITTKVRELDPALWTGIPARNS